MTEDKLIKLLKEGDPSALERLFLLYKDKVFNTAISYIQNKEDAEEITQDVFVELFNSAAGFKGNSGISTWIYRITVNKSLDALRYRSRKKRFAIVRSIFSSTTGELEIDKADFIHPGIETDMKEESAALFKALDKLPPNQKTAFILSKIEGLSNREISEIIGVSLSSVESIMFRAKQNLKKILSAYFK